MTTDERLTALENKINDIHEKISAIENILEGVDWDIQAAVENAKAEIFERLKINY